MAKIRYHFFIYSNIVLSVGTMGQSSNGFELSFGVECKCVGLTKLCGHAIVSFRTLIDRLLN